MAYLTVAEFRVRTEMPREDVDQVDAMQPGFIESQLEAVSARIDARLRKRYQAPFDAPYPLAVLDWTAWITTLRVYIKRGFNPSSDASFVQTYMDRAQKAEDEIVEAANSETGLFDLPLRQDVSVSGITKGTPLGYAEASPYVWQSRQFERARRQDR